MKMSIKTEDAVKVLTMMRDAYKVAADQAETALEYALDCQKMEAEGREEESMLSCAMSVKLALTIPIDLQANLMRTPK